MVKLQDARRQNNSTELIEMLEKHRHKEPLFEDMSQRQEIKFSEESQQITRRHGPDRDLRTWREFCKTSMSWLRCIHRNRDHSLQLRENWSIRGVLQHYRKRIATILQSLALPLRRIPVEDESTVHLQRHIMFFKATEMLKKASQRSELRLLCRSQNWMADYREPRPTSQWKTIWSSWKPTSSEEMVVISVSWKEFQKIDGVLQTGHPLTKHISSVQSVHKRGTHTTRWAQVTRIAMSSWCAKTSVVIWCDPCLCCSLTCRSPRAHHLPHSLFLVPRHKNTQHNRYNMIVSKNTQYIMHISMLSRSTSSATLAWKLAELRKPAHDNSHIVELEYVMCEQCTAHATFSGVWLKIETQVQGEESNVLLKRTVHRSHASCLVRTRCWQNTIFNTTFHFSRLFPPSATTSTTTASRRPPQRRRKYYWYWPRSSIRSSVPSGNKD